MSRPKSSPATFERPYETAAGRAASFRLKSGVQVRLEPREDGVAVAWSAPRDFETVTHRLGTLATSETDVRVLADHRQLIPAERGQALAARLRGMLAVDLVRVDRPDDTILWQSAINPATTAEMAILTASWTKARLLLNDLQEEEVASRIPDMLRKLN